MINSANVHHGKVLIVDDQKANVLVLERTLRGAGYLNVTSTMNSVEVCDLHRQNRYDLILLDLNMPRMSGWDFIEAVAAQPGLPPIVIFTSSIDPRDKARSAQYACVRLFLIKPLRLSDVRGLLHQS